MADIRAWSNTAGGAGNIVSPPDGAPEGMGGRYVNDVIRENMAAVRRAGEGAPWFDWGHTPTRTGATTFTVPTDLTAIYLVGRPIRVLDNGSYQYGYITASAYASVTTVTTSGLTLTSNLTQVAVSPVIGSQGAFSRHPPEGTSAGQGGAVYLHELAANGGNYTGFRAPDSLAANYVHTLPSNYGTTGQFLQTNGAGTLSWSVTAGDSIARQMALGILTL